MMEYAFQPRQGNDIASYYCYKKTNKPWICVCRVKKCRRQTSFDIDSLFKRGNEIGFRQLPTDLKLVSREMRILMGCSTFF